MRSRRSTLPALVSALGAFFLTSGLAWAAPPAARIADVEGSVQVRSPQSADWKTTKTGDLVEQGSSLKTSSQSSCDIALGEDRKSVVHMKADSLTLLNSLDPEKVRVDLQQGHIFSLVRGLKKDSKFVVSSPTAIASARGTGWEQGLDSVKVFESSVDVTGATGEEMLVGEGQGVEIAADGNLGEVFDLPEDTKEEWKSVENAVEQHAAAEPSGEPAGEASETDSSDAFSDGFAGGNSEEIESPGTETEDVLGEAQEQTLEDEDQENLDDDNEESCIPTVQNNYCS